MKRGCGFIVLAIFLILARAEAQDSLNLTMVSRTNHSWADIYDVALLDTLAYVAAGSDGLIILDISDSTNISDVGYYDVGSIKGLVISGDYAYLADHNYGLRILDISDPVRPVEVGSSHGMDANSISMSGNLVSLTTENEHLSSLFFIDVSDPTNPENITINHNHWRWIYSCFLIDQYAIVRVDTGHTGLLLWDVTDPANPVEIWSLPLYYGFAGVDYSQNYLYIEECDPYSGFQTLHIFEIADLPQHHEIASVDIPNDMRLLGMTSQFLFLQPEGETGFTILDFSDPANPIERGSVTLPQDYYHIMVRDNFVFAIKRRDQMIAFDIGDPDHPARRWALQHIGYYKNITVSGNYAYILQDGIEFSIFNISDPLHPDRLSFRRDEEYSNTAGGICIAGGCAYVAYSDPRIYNVLDPVNPHLVCELPDHPFYTFDVAITGNYAYLSAGMADSAQLTIFDISDPLYPTRTGNVVIPANPYAMGITVKGSYAYMADWRNGLQIFDISDPTNPIWLSECELPDISWSVAVAGDYAYVASYRADLQVVDVSDPENPFEIYILEVPGYVYDVVISGNYAFLSAGDEGLRVIDIEDPYHPVEVGFYDTPGSVTGVSLSGTLAYVSDETSLIVLDCSAFLTEDGSRIDPLPKVITVGHAYPNPFNPTVTVPFTLPQPGEVTFKVFNELGQQVFSRSQMFSPGANYLLFSASDTREDLASGMYFLRVVYNGQQNTQKLLLLR